MLPSACTSALRASAQHETLRHHSDLTIKGIHSASCTDFGQKEYNGCFQGNGHVLYPDGHVLYPDKDLDYMGELHLLQLINGTLSIYVFHYTLYVKRKRNADMQQKEKNIQE